MTKSRRPGVHVSARAGTVYFDMARYNVAPITDTVPPPDPTDPLDVQHQPVITGQAGSRMYVPWGADNMQPTNMIADIKECGVLSGGIHGKIRLGLGRGVQPMRLMERTPEGGEILEPVTDPEIEDWQDDNNLASSAYGWFLDLTGLGQSICRYKFNKKGEKIGIARRHDVSEMRYAPKNRRGHLTGVHLSAVWDKGSGYNLPETNNVISMDLLPEYGAVEMLRSMVKEGAPSLRSKEYAMVSRLPDWDRHYYSDPLWYAARKWVAIAKGVPTMKAAIFENNIRLKYKVTIHAEYWETHVPGWDEKTDDEQETARQDVYDTIDNWLAGAENSYKSIFVDGALDPIEKKRFSMIDIESIEDNTKPGELLPDSAAANIEILFALMMNPALMGANSFGKGYGGGAGSGSDIREATMVQIMIQEFERHTVQRYLNIPSRINGWKTRIPNLVWRFPGLVLTTLDKGKSTEAIV